MSTHPQFLFDFGSPNAFLSHEAIPAIEQRTGADSIPTIEEHYRVRDWVDGRYIERDVLMCVMPGCTFRCKDAETMWRHVHFGPHARMPDVASAYADLNP